MKKVKVKHPDFCQLAAAIVEAATDESEQVEDSAKNPQAVASGRRGGKKGGKARANKLTPEQRSAIAKKAAQTRWNKD
ncbi:MAG: hypothetical protein M1418_08875 [Deltaproteobacteria bacterium]|nr:hypothetical protein [Deltaproteobacteria bacterium]